MFLARTTTLIVLFVCAAASAAGRPARYAVMLADGKRLEGDRLSNWYDANGIPHLSGQHSLLTPTNPFRWLRDRSQPLPGAPPSFVEFTNGDRLPGVVVDYRSGAEDPYNPQPPHLVVRVALTFEPPENRPVAEIRVATQFVRRIVWQHEGRKRYQPGTALFRDGRELPFRAIRLHAGEVHVLLEGDDRRIDWSELAELCLPAVDPWTAWFDHVAAVCPTAPTRLIEMETSSGLIAMASLARLAARFEGNSSDPDRWVHGIQPAWSLDILWVPFREIAIYRTFAPWELPLSRVAPRQITQRSSLGAAWSVQVNRSVLGSPLRSGSLEFGWGFGAGGGSEITFDLPPGAKALRTMVCLDRAAGRGGCIKPRIFAGEAKGQPLWEGPVLVGSEAVADSGVLNLTGGGAAMSSIVLQIDAVDSERPLGADPLDIRDYADWCDPLLELDPSVVKAECNQRLKQRFVAWREWTVQTVGTALDHAEAEVSFHRNEDIPGAFEAAVQAGKQPLVLRRELTIGPQDNWLVIAANRPKERREEQRIEVWIGGEKCGESEVPAWRQNPQDNRPFVVSLAPFHKSSPVTKAVEVRQLSAQRNSAVQYRAIIVTEQLPTLQQLLEDDAVLTAVEQGHAGSAAMTADDHYSGARSLRLTPFGRFRLELPSAIRIRAQPKWGEARFLRLAVRKQNSGSVSLELDDAQPRDKPAIYEAGRIKPASDATVAMWRDNLPSGWVVITRDLFADFGTIDLRALVVNCADGEGVLLDHIYLGRHPSDFEMIPVVGRASRLP